MFHPMSDAEGRIATAYAETAHRQHHADGMYSDCACLWGDRCPLARDAAEATDAGSTSLFVACLLASLVPAVLVFLLVAPLLAAMSGLVQA